MGELFSHIYPIPRTPGLHVLHPLNWRMKGMDKSFAYTELMKKNSTQKKKKIQKNPLLNLDHSCLQRAKK